MFLLRNLIYIGVLLGTLSIQADVVATGPLAEKIMADSTSAPHRNEEPIVATASQIHRFPTAIQSPDSLSMQAALASYCVYEESRQEGHYCDDFFKKHEHHWIRNHVYGIFGVVTVVPEDRRILVAIRGTSQAADVMTDLWAFMRRAQEPVQFGRSHFHKSFHSGFGDRAEKALTIIHEIFADIPFEKYWDYELVCTGHSLGAAAATIISWRLYSDPLLPYWRRGGRYNQLNQVKLVLLGAPRTLSTKTASLFPLRHENVLRFQCDVDPVAMFSRGGMSHIGLLIPVSGEHMRLLGIIASFKRIALDEVKQVLEAGKGLVLSAEAAVGSVVRPADLRSFGGSVSGAAKYLFEQLRGSPMAMAWLIAKIGTVPKEKLSALVRHYILGPHGSRQYLLLCSKAFNKARRAYLGQDNRASSKKCLRNAAFTIAKRLKLPVCSRNVLPSWSRVRCVSCTIHSEKVYCSVVHRSETVDIAVYHFDHSKGDAGHEGKFAPCMDSLLTLNPLAMEVNIGQCEETLTLQNYSSCHLRIDRSDPCFEQLAFEHPDLFAKLYAQKRQELPKSCVELLRPIKVPAAEKSQAKEVVPLIKDNPDFHGAAECLTDKELTVLNCNFIRNARFCPRECQAPLAPSDARPYCRHVALCSSGMFVAYGFSKYHPESDFKFEDPHVKVATTPDLSRWNPLFYWRKPLFAIWFPRSEEALVNPDQDQYAKNAELVHITEIEAMLPIDTKVDDDGVETVLGEEFVDVDMANGDSHYPKGIDVENQASSEFLDFKDKSGEDETRPANPRIRC